MGSVHSISSAADVVSPAVFAEGFERMRRELEQFTPAELGAISRDELNSGIDMLGWIESFNPCEEDRKAIAERKAQLAIVSFFCAAQRRA